MSQRCLFMPCDNYVLKNKRFCYDHRVFNDNLQLGNWCCDNCCEWNNCRIYCSECGKENKAQKAK